MKFDKDSFYQFLQIEQITSLLILIIRDLANKFYEPDKISITNNILIIFNLYNQIKTRSRSLRSVRNKLKSFFKLFFLILHYRVANR